MRVCAQARVVCVRVGEWSEAMVVWVDVQTCVWRVRVYLVASRTCVPACVYACVCACVCVCMRVRKIIVAEDREGSAR